MGNSKDPRISVVLVSTGRRPDFRMVIEHLRAQTIREDLELIVVNPPFGRLAFDPAELSGFRTVHLMTTDGALSEGEMRAMGLRRAAAPLVAFVECHAYPAPEWAEAILEAHRRPWAAVGSSVFNANPERMLSWANLFVLYGPWVEMETGREVDDISAINGSYKRQVLLDFTADLAVELEIGCDLHQALATAGYRFYLEPRARLAHENPQDIADTLQEHFPFSRRFAALRCRRWSLARRLVYAVGSPLIPLVRLTRIMSYLRRTGRDRDLLPRVLPGLMLGLIASAAGEMVGYVRGMPADGS